MAELILSTSGSPPLSLSSANQTSSNGDLVLEWPEPIQRVQELAESGIESLPERYARALGAIYSAPVLAPLPVVDLSTIFDENRKDTLCMQTLSSACRQWGFFQVVNHGVSEELLSAAMATSRSFFSLDREKKLRYANNPATYEGYGSRMGVQKGIKLDWNDYFFHHLQPLSDRGKWPTEPVEYREVIREYGEKVVELCKRLLSIFSDDLSLPENTLLNCFGGDDGVAACYRMNYYPKCPQPELALGLSPHSDPGGFTVVLQDSVSGLQVNKEGKWYTVAPVKNALVIIIADQLEILTNGIYKSADHRTTTNNEKERMSLVVFFNPNGEQKIGPMEEVVGRSGGRRAYEEMSFNEYRKLIRTLGVQGKAILSSRALKCPKEEETKCAEEEEEVSVVIEP